MERCPDHQRVFCKCENIGLTVVATSAPILDTIVLVQLQPTSFDRTLRRLEKADVNGQSAGGEVMCWCQQNDA